MKLCYLSIYIDIVSLRMPADPNEASNIEVPKITVLVVNQY